jgi:hypothetical protein
LGPGTDIATLPAAIRTTRGCAWPVVVVDVCCGVDARVADRQLDRAEDLSGTETRKSLSRHGRACPGHPRLLAARVKSWMPGARPGMTSFY